MRRSAALVLLLIAFGTPSAASAQLRPLDPLDPWIWLDSAAVAIEVGTGMLWDQRASLAGTEGTLIEAGNFAARWRAGRVVLEAAGTVQRFHDEKRRFAEPTGGAEAYPDGARHDSGDYRVTTFVLLTPRHTPAQAVLRFGTRLPTTDNRVGLDRDATDFFALLGAGWSGGSAWIGAEGGVGINGARSTVAEQSDVFAYAVSAGWRGAWLSPMISLAGQAGGSGGRGNEALSELRAGVRIGQRRWVQVSAVRGLVPFSPAGGILMSAGWAP